MKTTQVSSTRGHAYKSVKGWPQMFIQVRWDEILLNIIIGEHGSFSSRNMDHSHFFFWERWRLTFQNRAYQFLSALALVKKEKKKRNYCIERNISCYVIHTCKLYFPLTIFVCIDTFHCSVWHYSTRKSKKTPFVAISCKYQIYNWCSLLE